MDYTCLPCLLCGGRASAVREHNWIYRRQTAGWRFEEGYIDGIIFSDPIRFAAYSGTNLVASTDYAWNTSIVSFGKKAFYAYHFRTPFSLFASQVWRFDAAGLKDTDSAIHVAISPFVWCWTRPISHFIFGILIALPIIFTIRNRPWRSKGVAVFGGCMAILFLSAFALCTLVVSIAYMPCSLWITLSISFAAIAARRTMIRMSNITPGPVPSKAAAEGAL